MVVGRRRPIKLQVGFSQRQWRVALVVMVGVVPLLLTVLSYRLFADVVGVPTTGVGNIPGSLHVLRQQVVALRSNTAAGLDAMGRELTVLDANAVQLSVLRDRLVRVAGLDVSQFRVKNVVQTSPTSSMNRPRLMLSLHKLVAKLSIKSKPSAPPRGRSL